LSRETERLVELAAEIGQRLGGALHDMIPPEAERHLETAQKELLTALVLIYENQMHASSPRTEGENSSSGRRSARRPAPTRSRSQRIDVE
jgi:hypothetical protein